MPISGYSLQTIAMWCAIQDILSHRFEQSRYVILEEILRELGLGDADVVKEEVGVLADRYDRLVLGSAKAPVPRRPERKESLTRLAPAYALYVSSTTPRG